MAVVFDTNVMISAAFFAGSKPALALLNAAENDLILGSAATLLELATTMERPKFDRYASLISRRDFVAFIYATVHVVEIKRHVQICRDPKDDKFLDVAVNGGADLIVTGDADLLALGSVEGIPIVMPADFLARRGG
jgi:putative PIN family toxin of toxin-antitoxin system